MSSTERELRDHGSGLKTLLIRRTYDASPEDVWDALIRQAPVAGADRCLTYQ